MVFNNPYWSNATKIEMLEDWIIVHSIIYYEMDSSVVSDHQFNENAKQLAKALKKYPESAAKSRYAYCFENFDGSTGHHLFWSLNREDKARFINKASLVLALSQRKGAN